MQNVAYLQRHRFLDRTYLADPGVFCSDVAFSLDKHVGGTSLMSIQRSLRFVRGCLSMLLMT